MKPEILKRLRTAFDVVVFNGYEISWDDGLVCRMDYQASAIIFCLLILAANSSTVLADTAIQREVIDVVEVRAKMLPTGYAGILGEQIQVAEAPLKLDTYPLAENRVPGSQRLSAVLQRDSSVGENYATSGFYENFTVRGFTLDRGSAYRINGFVVPAEFHVPLETMHHMEILKGIGGLHGGQVSAGGTINFVSLQPEDVRAASMEVDDRGGSLVSGDIGQALSGTTGLGYRLVAVHGELHPAQPDADGIRDTVGMSLHFRPSSTLAIHVGTIAQKRSQPAIPGFQLLGGTTLPDGSVRDLNINRQPWSSPVVNNGIMTSLRAELKFSEKLWMQAGVANTVAQIDDNLATPWGCNAIPFQYFCPNGDYVLYKYHASERRATLHTSSSLHFEALTGPLMHELTVGAERIQRRILQTNFYSSTLFDMSGNGMSGNLASTGKPLDDPGGVGTNLLPIKAMQTAFYVADRLSWETFMFLFSLRSVTIEQQPGGIHEQHVLPELALSWHINPHQQIYISRGRGLEFGSEAPLTASNAGSILAPRFTQQTEIGWKSSFAGFGWSSALFKMERPYEYTKPSGSSWAGMGDYVRGGQQVHHGMDVSWHTPSTNPVRLEGSLAYIRAVASGSEAYDGVQLQNVPRFSSVIRSTTRVPGVLGLETYFDWVFRGTRTARRDGSVSVPGYHIFNFGINCQSQFNGHAASVALMIRNFTNRHYWRDVGEAYSADLLFPGDVRSVAASVRLEF